MVAGESGCEGHQRTGHRWHSPTVTLLLSRVTDTFSALLQTSLPPLEPSPPAPVVRSPRPPAEPVAASPAALSPHLGVPPRCPASSRLVAGGPFEVISESACPVVRSSPHL